MSKRNIANFSTFNTLLVNRIEIQSSGEGLVIYNDDPNVPQYSFSTSSSGFSINGDLNVTGSAVFETITISEFEGGLFSLGGTNVADIIDIGIYGKYNTGSDLYAGFVRDANDSMQRWTLFRNIAVEPTDTVSGITTAELDSMRLNYIYTNDGSSTVPSITFNSDIDTGLARVANNELGALAGGLTIGAFRYIDVSTSEFELDATTSLKLIKLNTIDDENSDVGTVTSGNIYLESLYNEGGNSKGNDKWFKFYSASDAVVPSFAGVVLSSPDNHYFMTNVGNSLKIIYTSDVPDISSPPDLRDATAQDIITVTSNSTIESHLYLIIPTGNISNLPIRYNSDENTGFYHSGTDATGIVCGGVNVLNIAPSAVTSTQPILLPNGTLANPSVGFSANVDVGFYRDTVLTEENISVSINSTEAAKFTLNTTIPQIIMPINGTSAIPNYAFSNKNTGMYSPSDEVVENHIAFTLDAEEIFRLRKRTGAVVDGQGYVEFYNSCAFTPGGTTKRVTIDDDYTRVGELKSTNASFLSHNLIDDDLVALYTFDDPFSIGSDSSGNGLDAALSPSPPASKSGEVDVNGITKQNVLDLSQNPNSDVYLDNVANLASFTSLTLVTFSFWFKVNGAAMVNDGTIFNFYSVGGNISAKVLNGSDSMQVTIDGDVTTLQYQTANKLIKDNLWHHMIIRMGGVSPRMYLDNVALTVANTFLVYNQTGNTGVGNTATDTINDLSLITQFTIGVTYTGGIVSDEYIGYLKDFYVTAQIMNAGNIGIISQDTSIITHTINAAIINAYSVNATTPTQFSDGSFVSPSITFSNDPTLGFYRSGVDILGIAANSTAIATLSETVTQFYANSFEFDSTNDWVKIRSGAATNRLIFASTGTQMQHHLTSGHSAVVSNNFIDIYLSDASGGGNELGTNFVARFGQEVDSTGFISIDGYLNVSDGSLTDPAIRFNSNATTGLYYVTTGTGSIRFASNGVLKLQVGDDIIVGADTSATAKLQVPSGAVDAPSFKIIGLDVGLYGKIGNSLAISTNDIETATFNSDAITHLAPSIVDISDATAFQVKDTALANNGMFSVDTLNQRIGIGYTGLSVTRTDAYNSTTQRVKIDSNDDVAILVTGLDVFHSFYDFISGPTECSALAVGHSRTTKNAVEMIFHLEDDGSNSNKLFFQFVGVAQELLSLNADGTVNVDGTFTVTDQALVGVGLVSAPSYAFIGRETDGMYSPAVNQVAFATNSVSRALLTNTYAEYSVPIRLANGTISAPSLTFSNDTTNNSGFYLSANDDFRATAGGEDSFKFTSRTSGNPNINSNIFDVTPDGTNLRLRVDDTKLRASSNQTILETSSINHLKFITDPNTFTTSQDFSINASPILITGTVTHNVNQINLTDSAGATLLELGAIVLAAGNNSVSTTENLDDLLLAAEFKIIVKFKLITNGVNRQIFTVRGNPAGAGNFIQGRVNASNNLVIRVEAPATTLIYEDSGTDITLSVDIWYTVVFLQTTAGYSCTINDVNESGISGVTTFDFTDFGDVTDLTVTVGGDGTLNAINAYISEFLIAPTSTTEAVTSTFRTQAHEIYCNKLQMVDLTGLPTEGSFLICDRSGNLRFTTAILLENGVISFESSILRVDDGTLNNPSFSFKNAPSSGLYLSDVDTVSLSIAGTEAITVDADDSIYSNRLVLLGGFRRNYEIVATTSLTLDGTHNIVEFTNAATITVTLPNIASTLQGQEYILINNSSGGSLVINADASDTIDGTTLNTITLTSRYDRITLVASSGSIWYSI